MPVERGITNPEIVQAPEYPPSDEVLRQKRLTYLKENKPQMYRELKKDGELEEHLARKVKFCKETAQYLMKAGIWENEAWNRAIRHERTKRRV